MYGKKNESLEKLVIASHNADKINEISNLFVNYDLELLNSKKLNLCVPEETGNTFNENAMLKGKSVAEKTGMVSISDDSGLCIDSLGGKPGVFSANWAGPKKDFSQAINKIQTMMKFSQNCNNAKMICCMCAYWPNGFFKIFKGEVLGKIVFPPRGNLGFGYDPIFMPNSQPKDHSNLTFAEMDPKFKNKISHRNAAFKKLVETLNLKPKL